jgi:hypothetical protein
VIFFDFFSTILPFWSNYTFFNNNNLFNINIMKRVFYLSIFLVFLSTLPFYGQKLRVGVTAGLNVTTLSEPGNLYDNEALKTGFGGGLALNYAISESVGLQSGIIYEQKGFRKKHQLAAGEEKLTGMYNYLTVPLVMEGSMAIKGNTRLYGLTGVYAGFKTYAENALALTGNEWPMDATAEEIKSEDYGWILGGGVQVPAGNNLMQIGFKYSLGLAKVLETSPDDRNKSVLFGVTLFF